MTRGDHALERGFALGPEPANRAAAAAAADIDGFGIGAVAYAAIQRAGVQWSASAEEFQHCGPVQKFDGCSRLVRQFAGSAGVRHSVAPISKRPSLYASFFDPYLLKRSV
jgi:hypothetical protein